ncbi:unnamed protein product [Larinioides sclopetarius]|uniref:TIL domain-containing protein n=1 Tax=Larinioides sclopetarius TaxID=280406 RepID=A0AAV2AZX7_9ARAC
MKINPREETLKEEDEEPRPSTRHKEITNLIIKLELCSYFLVIEMLSWVLPFLGILSRTHIPTNEVQCNLRVTNGTVICVGDLDKTFCQVTCDGKFQGEFHCSTDEGWKEKLPYCVKEAKDLSFSIAICSKEEVYSECQGHCERTCSDLDKPSFCAPNVCVGSCVCGEGLVRGSDGKCVSADSCTGTERAVADVKALACDPGQCMRSCPLNPFLRQYGGICQNGRCVCIKPQ